METTLPEKYEKLKQYLASFGSAAVAFSAGVDSTFLLYAAKEALNDHVIAVTASSCFFPERELQEAKAFCEQAGVKHLIANCDVLSIEGVRENPKDRCYLCKKALFGKIIELAGEQGITTIVEGSNLDDLDDYRPGKKAIEELGVKSPLREAGLSKQEIRDLSESLNIPTFNKPSFACLASRIPYGELITEEKLNMVDRSEQLLLDMGFHQLRVRAHGNVARIELLPKDFERFMEESVRETVYEKLKKYGFTYVALDVQGYRTGSLNET